MKSSDLKSEFLSFNEANGLVKTGETTLLAVSGGMDSTVMAHLFHRSPFSFAIAHCNFQLRGDAADEDEQFVRQLAEDFNVRFFFKRFDTEKLAKDKGLSIQMAARELRYKWFEHLRIKEEFDKIAFAHHLNDQAETILLNLAKSTGISGLRGMPLKRDNIIRPLLFASRQRIEAYAAKRSIKYRFDESNLSHKYERNLIRNKLIPILEEINPLYIDATARTVENVKFAETLFRERFSFYKKRLLDFRNDGIYVPFRRLMSYPFPAQMLYELIRDYGFHWDQVKNIVDLPLESSGQEFVSTEWRLMKSRNLLIISPLQNTRSSRIFIKKTDKKINLSDGTLSLEIKDKPQKLHYPKDNYTAFLDTEKLEFPLILRPWKKGDYMYPLGMKKASGKVGKKKLSDLFTDLKLSQQEKENTWILQSGEKIAWVVGHRIDDRFKIDSSTGRIAVLEYKRAY